MAETMRRTVRVALILLAVAVLMVLIVGCGGSDANDQSTTSTTKPGVTTGGSTATSTQTMVVGGDTADEYEAALPDLEAAVAAKQDDLKALEDLAVAQFQTARYEEAAATYERMLAIKDDAFMRNNYANVLRDWGKTDEAETQYRKAIDTDPALTFAYVNLANLLDKRGDTKGALALLESCIDKVPSDDRPPIERLIQRLKATATTT